VLDVLSRRNEAALEEELRKHAVDPPRRTGDDAGKK
jgi:hypothetical protein